MSDLTDICLTITVGHRPDGTLASVVRFPVTDETITACADDPPLGLDAADNVLHDVAHTLLACRLGLRRSPVLERVLDLCSLSQRAVDLEEAANFAIQAWCAALDGRDHRAAVANVRTALERLEEHEVQAAREAFESLPRSARRPPSAAARRRVAGIEDPDDALDTAEDFDEERRTGVRTPNHSSIPGFAA